MASRPLLYSMDISHYCIAADRLLAFKGVEFDIRPVPYHDKQDLIKATGQDYVPTLIWDGKTVTWSEIPDFPRGGPPDPDVLPVGPERPRGRIGELGPPGPRGARLAVRRHESPAGPARRSGALGVRRNADARPRAVARPRDAPRGVPTGHEQAPRNGRRDPRRPRLDPRSAEPRRLRDLRLDLAV